jgi:hypothetical protein
MADPSRFIQGLLIDWARAQLAGGPSGIPDPFSEEETMQHWMRPRQESPAEATTLDVGELLRQFAEEPREVKPACARLEFPAAAGLEYRLLYLNTERSESSYGLGVLEDAEGQILDGATFRVLRDQHGAQIEAVDPDVVRRSLGIPEMDGISRLIPPEE